MLIFTTFTINMLAKINRCFIVVVVLLSISQFVGAQNDSIRLKNNDLLVGEVKSLTTGVLIIETDYSDKDFNIEFNKVRALVIQKKCIIMFTNGRRRFGNIKTDEEGVVVITLEDGEIEKYKLNEVIALQEISSSFWSRISGAIDLGYNFTKANNDAQFTLAGEIEYTGEKWIIKGKVNLLNSSQDKAENVERSDASLSLSRVLPRKWFLIGDLYYLSNTEQALDSRINPSLGLGKVLKSSNKLIWGASIGYSFNIEDFVDNSLNKSSSELFASTDLNMFDYKDFELKSEVKLYVSLSEKGRVRTDYDISLKYDLPLDFYIKLGFTLNFDNQPAIEGNDFDYIFTSGFGWEFN